MNHCLWSAAAVLTALARPGAAQCPASWQPGEGIVGLGGPTSVSTECDAIVEWDPDGPGPLAAVMIAAGALWVAGRAGASGVAAWNGADWSAMGPVFGSLSADGLIVYAGAATACGGFLFGNSQTLYGVVRWDGANWQQLGDGLEARASCLAEYNGRLIAGGSFAPTEPLELHNIAQWDGAGWSPVGPTWALDGNVAALVVHDGLLIAAGAFTVAGGEPVGHFVLRWDGPESDASGRFPYPAPYLEAGHTRLEFRRKGVATRLIREAESIARDRGDRTIGLAVGQSDNPEAKRLYEKLGYRDWGKGDFLVSWIYRDAAGTEGIESEVCIYMFKEL